MPRNSISSESSSHGFSQLYKAFSKEYDTLLKVSFVPSGSIIMDTLMGGGLPLGKFIEIYSQPGVGKTLLALHMARTIIENTDKNVIYIDSEKGLTDGLLEGTLLDTLGSRFGVFKISTFEECEKVIGGFLQDKNLALVIVDSITAIIPQDIIDKPINEVRPGIKAQFESVFLNKYKAICARHNFSMFFVNQMRTKIRMKGMTTEEGSGSFALKHYVDIRFKASAVRYFKDELGNNVGAEIEIKSIKNKVAGNLKANLVVRYGKGVNNIAAYISYLVSLGYLSQAGSYFELTMPGVEPQKFKGKDALEDWVKNHVADVEKVLVSKNVFKSVGTEEIIAEEAE